MTDIFIVCGGATTQSGTQIEAVAAAAKLINTAVLELVQGWEVDPTLQTTNIQVQ